MSYYDQVILLLEQLKPSEFYVKLNRGGGAIGGAMAGGLVGYVVGPPGSVIGALIGGIAGYIWGWQRSLEHDRLITALKKLPEGEKVRLIGVVQGAVGGADIQKAETFINKGNADQLLGTLKENFIAK